MNYIKEMRIQHYIKNILIFSAPIFSGQIFHIKVFTITFLGFVSFSLMCSCIYFINDICDIEKDRLHETKKYRPLAAGKIKIERAILFTILLFIISLGITYYISYNIISLTILMIYFIINLFYSVKGKNIPLLDIVLLSSGFLLRVLYGGYITGISISVWLYLIVITGAFYLGFGKRRNELIKSSDTTRKVLAFYSKEFLDKNMYSCMTLSVVFFSLWCLEKNMINESVNWMILVPILLLICIRYSMDIETIESSGDPVRVILKDKVLMGMGICFGILIFYMIYKK
jgi:decaprenyl-phosphate phosphoribosyltransferase